ncbi:MAG: hypothetical protein QUS33_03220 [Dehalococcoidia bacterium]|nr:hypothetical protein [Dehalococcoidia bacterium]
MVNVVLFAFIVLAVAAVIALVAIRTAIARRQAPVGHSGFAVSILPASSLGWWSVGLAIALVLALAVVSVLPGDDPLDADSSPALALSLKIVFIVISVASLVAGLVSLVKRKELSVLVFMGMLVTLWMGLINMVAHLFME